VGQSAAFRPRSTASGGFAPSPGRVLGFSAWFVAKYLGYRPRMYDGSMEEWGRRAELPVAK
jgi:hypothetical protein